MIRNLLKILSIAAVLLIGIVIRQFLESLWLVLTGSDSNGLSSLVSLITMIFSSILLLPIKQENKAGIIGLFKEVLIFLFIWIVTSLFAAFLHQPKHASIGFIAASLYLFSRLIINRSIGHRIMLELKEYSNIPRGSTILMSVAPVPRVFITQGFGLRIILEILKGNAGIANVINEEVFLKSFREIKVVELQGTLASFVKAVAENWNREVAIFCEAKLKESLFKIRVKLASDSTRAIESILNGFSKLDGMEDLEWAIEKWSLLKPCVKPIRLVDKSVFLQPENVPERLFIVGELEEVEKVALQVCFSQLRSNSRIVIINGEEDSSFENRVGKMLEAKGFKPYGNEIKTFRTSRGAEVILMRKADLKERIVNKFLRKPIVALWLRNFSEDIQLKAPLRVLTCNMPEANPALEADGILLLSPSEKILECFIPERYGLSLRGRMVMVSAKGVSILA